MRDFLKSSTFDMPDGEPLTIRELSAGGRLALMEATRTHKGNGSVLAATVVAKCCPEFAGCSADEVLDRLPITLLGEIAAAVYALSGIGVGDEAQAEKN